LDAEATVLDPTKRRQLEAIAGNFIHIHRARANALDDLGVGLEGLRDDATGKAIWGCVRERDRVVEIGDRKNRRDGTETLAGRKRSRARHVREYRWMELGAAQGATKEHARTGMNSLADRALQRECRGFV